MLTPYTTTGYHFDKEHHRHTLDGKPLYGVTTVLGVIAKPFLIPWACKLTAEYIVTNYTGEFSEELIKEAKSAHTKKKEEAGTKGTDVHEECENWIKNGVEGSSISFGNFKHWADKHKVKFLESEINLYSVKHNLGGICDLVLEIDGKKYIGDIKTSSSIYPEHFLQMGAYELMLNEMGLYKDKDISGYIVINLKKNGKMDEKLVTNKKEQQEGFLAALCLYKTLKA